MSTNAFTKILSPNVNPFTSHPSSYNSNKIGYLILAGDQREADDWMMFHQMPFISWHYVSSEFDVPPGFIGIVVIVGNFWNRSDAELIFFQIDSNRSCYINDGNSVPVSQSQYGKRSTFPKALDSLSWDNKPNYLDVELESEDVDIEEFCS